jgi:hypothetical protein
MRRYHGDGNGMKIAFVWPFWQAPAKYDELRWSVRSVYQNFVEPDCEIETIIVGDQPVLRRWKNSWYSGRVINVPRTVRGTGAVGLQDQCTKFLTALRDDSLPDTVVWMMDDVYFIKPVTLEDLKTPRHLGSYDKDRVAAWNPKGWWQAAKKRTVELLLSEGYPAYDFATHLPHVVDRQKARELIEKYDANGRHLLWEMLYENICLGQTPERATPFLRIISDSKCLTGTRNAAAKASVLVSAGNAWNEAHRTFLYETFPNHTPVEADAPVPPKGLKSRQLERTARVEHEPITTPAVHTTKPLVTSICNAYGRPANFPCQINALKRQTVANEIMVWQNHHSLTAHQWHRDWFDPGQMQYAKASGNLGVWARFAYALNAKTEFVCLWDDDAVPGPNWYENCLETIKTHDGLLGGNGVVFHSIHDYDNRTNHGWAYPNEKAERVDIVGHAWFVRREWLGLFWSEMPDIDQAPAAGEDFHFSYALQKFGIGTYVPPHKIGFNRYWSNENPKAAMKRGGGGPAISTDTILASKVRDQLLSFTSKGFRLIEHDAIAF